MNNFIFSLDPGSIRTGFAVLTGGQQLIEAGLIMPDKRTAAPEFRIHSMCRDLWQLLDKHQPRLILLEWCSGKVNKRRHKGSGQGLQVHGAATGSLWRECLAWKRTLPMEEQIQTKVILVLENDWTRGLPKQERAAAVAAIFREYMPEGDKGMDISDALGLAIWWLRRQNLKLEECLT